MIFCGKTDIGKKRTSNQDSFFTGYLDKNKNVFLAVLCDGMGGAAGGNIASTLAAGTFKASLYDKFKKMSDEEIPADSFCEQSLLCACKSANSALFKKALENDDLKGMGTTLVACLIYKDYYYIVNIGDSRLYIFSENKKLSQLTHDHSYVQLLIDSGKITPQQALDHPNKNVITRALGIEKEVSADIFKIPVKDNNVLLCSDGLTNFVSDETIETILKNKDYDINSASSVLIDTANENGGGDNITVIIIKQ